MRTLNMEGVEQQRTTGMLDASPVQINFNRMLSDGWLSASIVHDLRNPLATVFAGAEMLMELDPSPTQVKRLAANIYRAAGRMGELLSDLSGASCGNGSKSEICKIRDVIAAASEAAAERQSVEILNNVPGSLEIQVMRSRMERVFINLISNSLEAMPHGGKIHIGAKKADHCVLIAVEDTGPGIPRRIRNRLFEPFVTAGKDHGVGLGLALSRQTVLEHGGDMWSEPAAGALFVIRLPLREREDVLQRSHSAAGTRLINRSRNFRKRPGLV
jgi:signal transduction histidine kinase